MNERAANKRSAKRKATNDADTNNSPNRSRETGPPPTEEEMKRDIEILKTLTVSEANLNEIKEKLIATMTYRNEMMDVNELDLLENFPYFFTDPSLVIQKFMKN